MHGIGKALIMIGISVTVIGIFFMVGAKFSWFGHLPGDIVIQKKNFSFYFPITTSLVVSIFLSLLFYLFFRR